MRDQTNSKRNQINPDGTLKCTRCLETKHITEFYQKGFLYVEIDGVWYGKPNSWCSSCTKKVNAEGYRQRARLRRAEEALTTDPPKKVQVVRPGMTGLNRKQAELVQDAYNYARSQGRKIVSYSFDENDENIIIELDE